MEDSDNKALVTSQKPIIFSRLNNIYRRRPFTCAVVLTLTIICASLFGFVISGARSLSSSSFSPSKINVEDKGRSLTIDVTGNVQGGSWSAGAKLTSGSCTLHSFFDGEDFQVASVSTSFEKENVGFGVSKSTDPVAIELSLESFDASALRMMLQRCWTYYTHYKARLLFDTLLPKSMSPEPPPPFQLELRCSAELALTTFLSPSYPLMAKTVSFSKNIEFTNEQFITVIEKLDDKQTELSFHKIMEILRKPVVWSNEYQVPSQLIPASLEEFTVKVPETAFTVGLPGPSTWLVTMDEIAADLTTDPKLPFSFEAKETSGQVMQVWTGASKDLEESGAVEVEAKSDSESFLAYILGKKHTVSVLEARYASRFLAEEDTSKTLKHLELDVDSVSQVSVDFDRDVHTLSFKTGSQELVLAASIVPPSPERKLIKEVGEIVEHIMDNNDVDSLKEFLDFGFGLSVDEIWNEGDISFNAIAFDVNFFNIWDALGGDAAVSEALSMTVQTTYEPLTEHFTLYVNDEDQNGAEASFNAIPNHDGANWLVYGSGSMRASGKSFFQTDFDVALQDFAPRLDINVYVGEAPMGDVDLDVVQTYHNPAGYDFLSKFSLMSIEHPTEDFTEYMADYVLLTTGYDPTSGDEYRIHEALVLRGDGNVTQTLVSGEKITSSNFVIKVEVQGKDEEWWLDTTPTIEYGDETFVTFAFKSRADDYVDQFHFQINPFTIKTRPGNPDDDDFTFHHVHTLLFQEYESEGGFHFETSADIEINDDHLIDASLKMGYLGGSPVHDFYLSLGENLGEDDDGDFLLGETWAFMGINGTEYYSDGNANPLEKPSLGHYGVEWTLTAVDEHILDVNVSFGFTNALDAWTIYAQNNGITFADEYLDDVDGLAFNVGGGGEDVFGLELNMLPLYLVLITGPEGLLEAMNLEAIEGGTNPRWGGDFFVNYDSNMRVMSDWLKLDGLDSRSVGGDIFPLSLTNVQFRGWEEVPTNLLEISVVTEGGQTVPVYEKGEGEPLCPVPLPYLDLGWMRGDKVVEVIIKWEGPYTPAMESIEYRLIGFREMSTEDDDEEDQGLIGVKYYFDEENFVEREDVTFMKMSGGVKVSDANFFTSSGDGLWGSSLILEAKPEVSAYIEAKAERSELEMTMHSLLEVHAEEENDEGQKEMKRSDLRMKMVSSSARVQDEENFCEESVITVWDAGSEDAQDLTFQTDASEKEYCNTDGGTDICMGGCTETFGDQRLHVDGEDEGEFVFLDESILPEVLKTVGIKNMNDIMGELVLTEDVEPSHTGTIGVGHCKMDEGCYNNQSCDAILNALDDPSVTCSTLSASGCDCRQCKCHPSTGRGCNAVGREEECGDGLVCANWPSGPYYDGGREWADVGRRKLFGDMIYAKICVPKDWL